jgi:hypothetical protein
MKNIVVSAIAAAVLVSLAGTASAQALKPEEMIKIRKSGYSFMAWNMGKIKANVDGEFNKEQVVAAANLVAATANSGMGALFARVRTKRSPAKRRGSSQSSSNSPTRSRNWR